MACGYFLAVPSLCPVVFLQLETLLGCCCKRKSFLADMVKKVGALQLVALRDQPIAQEILCLMLEWQLLHSQEQQMQVVTTLQSTNRGMESYRQLCKRQDHLRELVRAF